MSNGGADDEAASSSSSTIFGEALDRVPAGDEWEICRPIVDRRLSGGYISEAAVTGDVHRILEWALLELLDVQPADHEVRALSSVLSTPRASITDTPYWTPSLRQEYSVILVVPDSASHAYLRAFSDLLLAKLGFRQLSLLQESLGASFGAGLSAACVVDLGATTTTIGCVEDGLVVADSRCVLSWSFLLGSYGRGWLLTGDAANARQTLAYGGADLTAWFGALLRRSAFPYAELDIQDPLDFKLVQGLKEKLCTLNEVRPASAVDLRRC